MKLNPYKERSRNTYTLHSYVLAKP
jgi:hypothetical protein